MLFPCHHWNIAYLTTKNLVGLRMALCVCVLRLAFTHEMGNSKVSIDCRINLS